MQKLITYEQYSPEKGIQLKWENGYEINCVVKNGVVQIAANKEGLISLANHLVNLSQDDIPKERHIHLDETNSLEDGSVELIILKK